MNVLPNATPAEFLDELRLFLIERGEPTAIIDHVDRLREFESHEFELEELSTEKEAAIDLSDDILSELEALIKAIDENVEPDNEAVEAALKRANDAVERFKE